MDTGTATGNIMGAAVNVMAINAASRVLNKAMRKSNLKTKKRKWK